eukprot:5376540-Ditylum_brightwellii.AAC.1
MTWEIPTDYIKGYQDRKKPGAAVPDSAGKSGQRQVYTPPINTDNEESDSNVDNHNESNNKKRSSNRILRNNAAKAPEMKTKKSDGDPLIPI